MKKLKKLNLVSLGDKQFSKQELINMKGGYSGSGCCGCGCPNNNDAANQEANWYGQHYDSIGGGAKYCWLYPDWESSGNLPNCY